MKADNVIVDSAPPSGTVLNDNDAKQKYLVMLDGKVKFSSFFIQEAETFKNTLSENDRARADIVIGTNDNKLLLLG